MYCYPAIKFLLLLSLFISSLKSFSQEYSYNRLDTKDGLPSPTVYDALQDSEGFMWFATESGLSRFDGKQFKTFTTKDGLSDNEILKLFLDSEGRIWIMPFKSALHYYYKGKIHNKNNDSLLAKIILDARPFDMAEDKAGNLFIADAELRTEYIILKNGIVRTIKNVQKTNISIRGLGVDKQGEVQFLLSEFSRVTGFKHYFFNPLKEKLTAISQKTLAGDVSTFLITPDYVIIPNDQISRITLYKNTNEVLSIKIPKNTTSISHLDKNRITINTIAGMQIFDIPKKSFSNRLFKDFSITSSFLDKEQNVWMTTAGSGVLMVPSFQFRNYSFPDDKNNTELSALFMRKNTLYAAGSGKKLWKSKIDCLKFSSLSLPSFERGKVICILPVSDKLLVINSASYQNPFTARRVPLSLKSANAGRTGIIYASHLNALLCKWSADEEIIWEGRTTCALEKDSGFYIGTLNGLFYKSYSGRIVNMGEIFPALASRIVNLAISDDGVLWITTKGNGIAGFADNKVKYHFTEKDGLTSDNCTSLCVDGNIVWLGTEKGLNRIDIFRRNQITRFSMSDGLPSNTISAIAALGDKVFVGTPKGLTYFEVNKISHTSTCDLQLTGIYVANQFWCYDSTNFSLEHQKNDIRFEFSGISFKSAGEMTYKYRLLGLQPEWRTTTEDQLSFPSLSSGEYTLQLKAMNKYGVESNTKEVSFVIEKFLWERIWFKIVTALLFAGGVWVFVAYRVKKVRQKEKEKTEIANRIAELEQKALRSQMNPHFIFNCLNSIQQYVAERDITGANNFITDFSRLIRMTLDLSTHPLINLCDEVDYISTYLRVERARLEDAFDYRVNIEESLDVREVHLPPLLLQPYVENSIRHGIRYKTGGDGLVQINICKKNHGILISIEDNGIGREAAKKYKSEYHIQYQSKGMSINEDRIRILNTSAEKKIGLAITDLYDSKKEPTGTRVDIYLP